MTLSCRERLWGNQGGTCSRAAGGNTGLDKKTNKEGKSSWTSVFPRKGEWAERLRRTLYSGVIFGALERLSEEGYGGASLAIQWLTLPLAGAAGSIPRALWSKNQNIKWKQYCNRFNTDFKNGPHQKKKKNFQK